MGCFPMFKSKNKIDMIAQELVTYQNAADGEKVYVYDENEMTAQPQSPPADEAASLGSRSSSMRLAIWWRKVTAWISSHRRRFNARALKWRRRNTVSPATNDEDDIPSSDTFPTSEAYPNVEGYIKEVVTEMMSGKLHIPLSSSPSIESLDSVTSITDSDTLSIWTSVWDSDDEEAELMLDNKSLAWDD